jgi:hypothetical protein
MLTDPHLQVVGSCVGQSENILSLPLSRQIVPRVGGRGGSIFWELCVLRTLCQDVVRLACGAGGISLVFDLVFIIIFVYLRFVHHFCVLCDLRTRIWPDSLPLVRFIMDQTISQAEGTMAAFVDKIKRLLKVLDFAC